MTHMRRRTRYMPGPSVCVHKHALDQFMKWCAAQLCGGRGSASGWHWRPVPHVPWRSPTSMCMQQPCDARPPSLETTHHPLTCVSAAPPPESALLRSKVVLHARGVRQLVEPCRLTGACACACNARTWAGARVAQGVHQWKRKAARARRAGTPEAAAAAVPAASGRARGQERCRGLSRRNRPRSTDKKKSYAPLTWCRDPHRHL